MTSEIEEINKITAYAVMVAKDNLFDARMDNQIDEFDIILTSLFNKGFNLGQDIGNKKGVELAQKEFLELINKLEPHRFERKRNVWEELKKSLDTQKLKGGQQ